MVTEIVGMDAHGLYQCIQNADSLSAETLDEVKQLLEIYPYFQTLKLLYLKALSLHQSPDFEAELNRLAIDVADRRVLYTLLKGSAQDSLLSPAPSAKPAKNSFDLIDAFLASNPQGGEAASDKQATLFLESSAATDYFHWSQSNANQTNEVSSSPSEEKKLKHQDLIDSFIENEPLMRKRTMPEEAAADETAQEKDEADDISIKPLDDTYFTETLARIYVKQKRYDKALQIIRNLYLKYPEKNIYFADQIRFLEKLIINSKK